VVMEEADVAHEVDEAEGQPGVTPLELLLFVVRAAKRHFRLSVIVGAVIATFGVGIALSLPPRFEAETRILFLQTASVAAALSTPIEHGPNTVTHIGESSELLMQKSSMLKMVADADLLAHFRTHRSFPLRVKDRIVEIFREPLSDQKMAVMLAETLQTRMLISHVDTMITIHVAWSDPDMAVKLARIAQKRFLEMREEQELSGINVAIAINEDELKNASLGIDRTLEEVVRAREQARRAAGLD